MPNEELYRKLYAKYAPHLNPDEINEKLKYASTLKPSEFINSFYKKYTGENPNEEQSEYINTVIEKPTIVPTTDIKHVSVLDLEEEVAEILGELGMSLDEVVAEAVLPS